MRKILASDKQRGERVVDVKDYFIGLGINIMRMTCLSPAIRSTAIRMTATWLVRTLLRERRAHRQAWEFWLVKRRSAIRIANGRIEKRAGRRRRGVALLKRWRGGGSGAAGKPRTKTADMAGKMVIAACECRRRTRTKCRS